MSPPLSPQSVTSTTSPSSESFNPATFNQPSENDETSVKKWPNGILKTTTKSATIRFHSQLQDKSVTFGPEDAILCFYRATIIGKYPAPTASIPSKAARMDGIQSLAEKSLEVSSPPNETSGSFESMLKSIAKCYQKVKTFFGCRQDDIMIEAAVDSVEAKTYEDDIRRLLLDIPETNDTRSRCLAKVASYYRNYEPCMSQVEAIELAIDKRVERFINDRADVMVFSFGDKSYKTIDDETFWASFVLAGSTKVQGGVDSGITGLASYLLFQAFLHHNVTLQSCFLEYHRHPK